MPNPFAFATYVLLTTFTPGPNNIMAMTNASRVGLRRGMRFNVGVFAGFVVIASAAAIFSLTLYRLIPNFRPIMTVVGAAYILWLAWKVLRSTPHAEDGAGELGFGSGMVLQLVNAKVVLYSFTVMGTFVIPCYRAPWQLLGFAVSLAFVGFVSTTAWAAFGAAFERVLTKHHRIINIVMALLLVYCAVSLFFE